MVGSLFLASYSNLGGGAIGNILFQWEQAGVFSYLLPFLIIFALVFGVLSKLKLFGENKGINAIISLAVGLMSLQFNFVSVFFSEIFPRMGMALSVILVLLVLAGLFLNPKSKGLMNGIMVVVLLIVVVVVLTSFNSISFFTGFGSGGWFRYNWQIVIGILAFVGAIIWIIAPKVGGNQPENDSILTRLLNKAESD
ncbi:hypothetical protein HOD29_05450 [archaeon]|jgi:hypothetical protein|nr:hypothetical protein [archaeon]